MRTREAETVEANYPVHSTWNRVNVFPLQTGGIGLVIQEKPADKRMKLIAESQSNAMGLALAGASLEDVLDILVLTVEKNAGHKVYASILLVSDNQQFLQHGAAPSLPDYYCKAIDGIEIEDNLGACGTTA
ncbi:hypothetical protein CA267_005795 [Alteromonas pelagimontana]|uniref:Uncharacterized protein n=1 Tax=Alteromonas pelagimontana TaxID=1858656 RepID=A0A6M4MAV1_9ALTE|nr:hypothetical protein [Alteromonas pelagimontana]QJR80321.1 hypothetical protein CA267_005795 [Alteromonas pelagimontana]